MSDKSTSFDARNILYVILALLTIFTATLSGINYLVRSDMQDIRIALKNHQVFAKDYTAKFNAVSGKQIALISKVSALTNKVDNNSDFVHNWHTTWKMQTLNALQDERIKNLEFNLTKEKYNGTQ